MQMGLYAFDCASDALIIIIGAPPLRRLKGRAAVGAYRTSSRDPLEQRDTLGILRRTEARTSRWRRVFIARRLIDRSATDRSATAFEGGARRVANSFGNESTDKMDVTPSSARLFFALFIQSPCELSSPREPFPPCACAISPVSTCASRRTARTWLDIRARHTSRHGFRNYPS